MIIITGAAGFIGSNLITKLNQEGFNDLILVDKFDIPKKNKNIKDKNFTQKIDRDDFFGWLDANHQLVQFIIHLGACSATTGYSKEIYDTLNFKYSKNIWNACLQYGLPLIYASSAATYGLGENGYDDKDTMDHLKKLQPLNLYGKSKNDFDIWTVKQKHQPYFWTGLKFFNVYGPNEYHKGRMSSVIYQAFQQIHDNGQMKLFRSHNPKYKDGEQCRDFVYVKDCVEVIYFLMNIRKHSGIYNVGTGRARTFYDLAINTFKAMDIPENIVYIDTPKDIRNKYQYFTQANMQKLRAIGYNTPFHSLEEGINDYVKNYLLPSKYI